MAQWLFQCLLEHRLVAGDDNEKGVEAIPALFLWVKSDFLK